MSNMEPDDYDKRSSLYASLDQIATSDKPVRNNNVDPNKTPSPESSPETSPAASIESDDSTLAPPPSYSSGRGSSSIRSSPKRLPQTKILGAIEEDGGMKPDIPLKSNRRRHAPLNTTFLSSLFPSASPKLVSRLEANEYDGVMGPRGEKFSDARMNRRSQEVDMKKRGFFRRATWRTWTCIALVIVMLAAITAIGLVVGLTRKKSDRSNNNDSSTSNTTITTFPVGTYTIQPYLLNITSSCTPNPATWRCYPYQTYATSASGSMTTLTWAIVGSNDTGTPTYSISASSNPFALPFSNAELTLVDSNSVNERYTFQTVLEKVVIPDATITNDGSSARCYYNQSMLIGELYTKKQPTLRTEDANKMGWPHAVSVVQSASGLPECWKVVDGNDVERVDVNGVSGGAGCACDYADYQ